MDIPQRPRVVYWNSQPTPYMVDRWNEVARRGHIEMMAWFNVEREADRSWAVDESSWLFNARYLERRRVLGRDLYLPHKELSLDRPHLIVQEYANPSSVLGFVIARVDVPRIAFRFLPTHETWVKRSHFKEGMKHWLFRSVDAVKTAGNDGRTALEHYHVPSERSFAVTQSIDVEHFGQAQSVSAELRRALRRELGLTGCVFVYVGRLWEKKGIDVLLEAFRRLVQSGNSASLLLIGDGVDEHRYREMTRDLPNVIFAGFKQKSELPTYYALADIFVFPTLGDPHGLVVDEAMAAGLPVITSAAAGDIYERVPDGLAGFVVPTGDADALYMRMRKLFDDSNLRSSMANYALMLAAGRGPVRYAEDFEQFVFRVMEMPPRTNPLVTVTKFIGKVASVPLTKN